MHLIEEQESWSAAGFSCVTSGLNGRTNVLDAGHHGGKCNELRIRLLRNQTSECGLSGAGRSPENQGMQLSGFNGVTQGLTGPQHLLLPDELIQRAGPHAVRKRPQWITSAHGHASAR